MQKERPNIIPLPHTIARHFAQGKYCDYPTDITLQAVNSHDLAYNPTAIPVKLGFKQTFLADFNAFAYLSQHKAGKEISEFLSDPNSYMDSKGISLKVPLDPVTARIMATMVEDDMLRALREPEGHAVCSLVYSCDKTSWPYRHPERFDPRFMKQEAFVLLKDIPWDLDKDYLETHGFNDHMGVNLLFISDFFAGDQ